MESNRRRYLIFGSICQNLFRQSIDNKRQSGHIQESLKFNNVLQYSADYSYNYSYTDSVLQSC